MTNNNKIHSSVPSFQEWFPVTDQETVYLSKTFEFTSCQVMTEFFLELLSVNHDTKYCLCADKTKDPKTTTQNVEVAIRSTESAVLEDMNSMPPEVSQLVESVENLYSKKCNDSVKRSKKQSKK